MNNEEYHEMKKKMTLTNDRTAKMYYFFVYNVIFRKMYLKRSVNQPLSGGTTRAGLH
jgi:hypothetical protein